MGKSEGVFSVMRRSASAYTIYVFPIVQQIRRATLAGFSETNGVVYAKFHNLIIRITVLYELIKRIAVLYNSNSAIDHVRAIILCWN